VRDINKIWSKKAPNCKIVDDCASEASIAERFALRYEDLYSSVPYDHSVLHDISDEVENGINSDSMYSDCVISCSDVYNAISKLAPHKNDGKYELSSDHFIQAGADLSVHIGFLLSAALSHGTVPTDFSVNTILPIPKVKNASVSSSDNFRGIALSSIFVKLFDHIVINRFHDKLCTSELQFGFKNNSSTHMCTMVLKETLLYYTHHNSFVYCAFLDATKAFDRVNFVSYLVF